MATTIADWLKGITNNTKSSTYKTTSNPTSASVSAAAKQAAADAQINSTKSSNLSGSATTVKNASTGKNAAMTAAGNAAYAATGDSRAAQAAAARAGTNYDAAAKQAAADAQVNSTKPSTKSGSANSNKSDVAAAIVDMLNRSSSGSSNKTPASYSGSSNSSSSNSTVNFGSFGGSAPSSSASANAAQLILGLPVEAQRAALSDIQSLADLYGIDYNRDSIESVFKDATNAAHEANLKEYDRTARQYYDKLGATQNSLIDTLRKQRAASITSGANAGMQNATELSEILGLTQTVSPDALALAQDRNALIEAYNAQLAQDVHDAMEYSDQLKQALAALASEKYGYDAQQYVAELSHNANVQAQNTASSAAYTGNKYATLEDILGLAVVPSLTYTKKE